MKIKLKNIYKNYPSGSNEINVLKDLNLEVDSGQSVAIMGQSGCGKSTLLSLLSGMLRPDKGEVFMDGVSIGNKSENWLTRFRAKHMGIVFQQFHLMKGLTALENVSLPLEILQKENARAQALDALAQVGLQERAEHTPIKLSGGECQRVALARAFVTKPKILLADEPTGNLDEKTGKSVIEILFKLVEQENASLILVTHSLNIAGHCQKHYTLKDGQIYS